jgi:hypothetical protein
MLSMRAKFALAGFLGVFTVMGLVGAADHLDGHNKVKGKNNGKHMLGQKHGTVAHAHLSNGKVTGVSASHVGGRDMEDFRDGDRPGGHKKLKVTKYSVKAKAKNGKKVGLNDLPGGDNVVHVFASDLGFDAPASRYVGLGGYNGSCDCVGWGYSIPQTQIIIIYWFPVYMCEGGLSGCTPWYGSCSGIPNYPSSGYPDNGGYGNGGYGGYGSGSGGYGYGNGGYNGCGDNN